MQNFSQVPIFSDIADLFYYPVLTNSANSDAVSISTANGTGNGYVTLVDQNYFLQTGWHAWTNYDNAGGVAETEAVTAAVLAGPPFVPNNFTVKVSRTQNNAYSNGVPLTQAELCSAGAYSGKQFPIPVLYGPSITWEFEFTDTTGLYLLTAGDAAIPLQIKLFMVGYKVPVKNYGKFLEYFPGLRAEYPQQRIGG